MKQKAFDFFGILIILVMLLAACTPAATKPRQLVQPLPPRSHPLRPKFLKLLRFPLKALLQQKPRL
jgi:hypothetical protein